MITKTLTDWLTRAHPQKAHNALNQHKFKTDNLTFYAI